MGRLVNNPLAEKSMLFAIRIVNLSKYLSSSKSEFVMSKQILRSGTSIGANIREAVESISRNEFIAKLYISMKEARETEYWLELLYRTDYLLESEYQSLSSDCNELCKLLTSIIKTAKAKQ